MGVKRDPQVPVGEEHLIDSSDVVCGHHEGICHNMAELHPSHCIIVPPQLGEARYGFALDITVERVSDQFTVVDKAANILRVLQLNGIIYGNGFSQLRPSLRTRVIPAPSCREG